MWFLYSLLSAVLVGCVPILSAKPSRMLGAEKSAISRAAIVLIGAGVLVWISGDTLPVADPAIWLIFAGAGLFDAAAWLLFYRAITQESTEVAVIREKACVPLSILLACGLSLRFPSFLECAAILLFVVGILYATHGSRLILPFYSAICTALQMQLSKFGIERVGSQIEALFLRSLFSLTFLSVFTRNHFRKTKISMESMTAYTIVALLLLLTGTAAFFAWKFCFSALAIASAAQVQAVTKLSFWITGLYHSFRERGINRRSWFGYVAMTAGALVLIV